MVFIRTVLRFTCGNDRSTTPSKSHHGRTQGPLRCARAPHWALRVVTVASALLSGCRGWRRGGPAVMHGLPATPWRTLPSTDLNAQRCGGAVAGASGRGGSPSGARLPHLPTVDADGGGVAAAASRGDPPACGGEARRRLRPAGTPPLCSESVGLFCPPPPTTPSVAGLSASRHGPPAAPLPGHASLPSAWPPGRLTSPPPSAGRLISPPPRPPPPRQCVPCPPRSRPSRPPASLPHPSRHPLLTTSFPRGSPPPRCVAPWRRRGPPPPPPPRVGAPAHHSPPLPPPSRPPRRPRRCPSYPRPPAGP